jgi:hypothetical protein
LALGFGLMLTGGGRGDTLYSVAQAECPAAEEERPMNKMIAMGLLAVAAVLAAGCHSNSYAARERTPGVDGPEREKESEPAKKGGPRAESAAAEKTGECKGCACSKCAEKTDAKAAK